MLTSENQKEKVDKLFNELCDRIEIWGQTRVRHDKIDFLIQELINSKGKEELISFLYKELWNTLLNIRSLATEVVGWTDDLFIELDNAEYEAEPDISIKEGVLKSFLEKNQAHLVSFDNYNVDLISLARRSQHADVYMDTLRELDEEEIKKYEDWLNEVVMGTKHD